MSMAIFPLHGIAFIHGEVVVGWAGGVIGARYLVSYDVRCFGYRTQARDAVIGQMVLLLNDVDV